MSDEIEKLQEEVQDLRERVFYLERELEVSVDEKRFERKISKIFPLGNEYEIDTNGMGYYTAKISVNPGDLPNITSNIDEMDGLGWQVEESDEEIITLSVEQGLINR